LQAIFGLNDGLKYVLQIFTRFLQGLQNGLLGSEATTGNHFTFYMDAFINENEGKRTHPHLLGYRKEITGFEEHNASLFTTILISTQITNCYIV
jgi:hypothetical protein